MTIWVVANPKDTVNKSVHSPKAKLSGVMSKRKAGRRTPSTRLQSTLHTYLPRNTGLLKDGTQVTPGMAHTRYEHHFDTETNGICLEITPSASLYMFRLNFAWLYMNYSTGFNSYKREYNPIFCYKRS